MKKKHCIVRLLIGATAMFLITHTAASAADRVVVIPLGSGSGDTGGVSTVTSAGQVWMDRNLGALRVATKSDDSQAYGSLYQWGRLGDGHEYRESPTTLTKSPGNVPGHGNFIKSPNDWRATPENSLWQGASGINNPCPAGFRLPTETELNTEKASWGSNNAAGAFASPLKLVVAGWRQALSGFIYAAGSYGYCWSSTVDGSSAHLLGFYSDNANMYVTNRADGRSIRCIKD